MAALRTVVANLAVNVGEVTVAVKKIQQDGGATTEKAEVRTKKHCQGCSGVAPEFYGGQEG